MKSRINPATVSTYSSLLEYPGHLIPKRVTSAGTFRFKHKLRLISNALEQHQIGLEEVDDGI